MLVDANLLLHAQDASSPLHERARQWWDAQLSGDGGVALCWPVLTAFVRISTNPRVFAAPLSLPEASELVDRWLECPAVRVVHPTSCHWVILRSLLAQAQASGNLVSDAHLAALATENGCELCTTDRDFARFPGLRCRNLLA